nr:class A beta-lactamase [Mycobacterium gordonae]
MGLPRRRMIVAAAALTAAVAAGNPRRPDPPILLDTEEPWPPIDARLAALEASSNASIGLFGLNPASGRELGYRADDMFATCSTFKAYVAAQILQQDQRGELRLTDTVYIDPAAAVPVASPVTKAHIGERMPLSELCAAAVRHSDNTATNLMLAMLGGPPSVTAFARSVGDDRTSMVRWETELNTAYPGDPRDTTSPRAMGTGFLTMLTGDVLDAPHRAQLEEWMRTIVTGDRRIRAGLPPGWSIADKTGSGDYASTNDIGVASGPHGERVLLAVMTRTRSNDPEAPTSDALIADVTKLAVPWLLVPV